MAVEGLELEPSKAYTNQLQECFGDDIMERIAAGVRQIPLPHCSAPGETLPVLRLDPAEPRYERPVLVIPGFTAGVVAKLPFAAEMAHRGFDTLLPGQNRSGILRDPTNKRSATYSQAMNYLALLGHTETEGPVDFVTHSYGSLIFQAMHRLANERQRSYFTDSKVVMLAPAGSNDHEWFGSLAGRFLVNTITEARTAKDMPDPGDMARAGAKNFMANMPRTIREMWELTRLRMDYPVLTASELGVIVVAAFAEDRLYPDRVMESTMTVAIEAGVRYATPISLQPTADNKIRSGKHASHNDEQFNPERPVGLIEDVLRFTDRWRVPA
ncbi:MAG TPA: hypothetical protein VK694_06315 [Verrucomicrobiae bacterium]|nr:hypothetical protein [Verrucomicrobiae bacterium]